MRSVLDIRRLSSADVALARAVNRLFGEAFDEAGAYAPDQPDDAHLRELLGKPHVIVLAALAGETVSGALVAYELDKLERARREIYIYDLAVAEARRRQGVATALIGRLREIGRERGAWVIYVQADYGDDPAIQLYQKLGVREDLMHFDIKP